MDIETPNPTPPPNPRTVQERTVDYLEKKAEIPLIAAMAAAERLSWENERQQRMIDAEDRAAASAMGWEIPEPEPEEEDGLKVTAAGDVKIEQHPAAEVAAKGLGALAAGLLGAAFPGAGIVGALAYHFLLAPKNEPPPPSPASAVAAPGDETLEIGLGRIEDYPFPTMPKGNE